MSRFARPLELIQALRRYCGSRRRARTWALFCQPSSPVRAMLIIMNVAIPPEFESYARDQVKAGLVASEAEAATQALRRYAAHIAEIRALVDPAIAQADRGEGMDGDDFMQELIVEARAAHGG